ncbi:MAG: type IV secretory pathway TraG/TraD family ATPase VirD4 [Rickettsiales bacterium]
MPRDEEIVLIESQPAIRCNKIFYYKEKLFTSRLLPKIKIPAQDPYTPDYSRNKKGKEDDKPADDANEGGVTDEKVGIN